MNMGIDKFMAQGMNINKFGAADSRLSLET
jgi:hypothetical protein